MQQQNSWLTWLLHNEKSHGRSSPTGNHQQTSGMCLTDWRSRQTHKSMWANISPRIRIDGSVYWKKYGASLSTRSHLNWNKPHWHYLSPTSSSVSSSSSWSSSLTVAKATGTSPLVIAKRNICLCMHAFVIEKDQHAILHFLQPFPVHCPSNSATPICVLFQGIFVMNVSKDVVQEVRDKSIENVCWEIPL